MDYTERNLMRQERLTALKIEISILMKQRDDLWPSLHDTERFIWYNHIRFKNIELAALEAIANALEK